MKTYEIDWGRCCGPFYFLELNTFEKPATPQLNRITTDRLRRPRIKSGETPD